MGRNIHTTHPLSNRVHWGYPFWKHAYHPCTQWHTQSCYLLLPQTCIESSLYKLNALALITQKLYLKDSTHFKKNNAIAMSWYYPHMSGDSAQSFIQSQFLKSRWHPVCWLAWVFSRRDTPPPTLQRRETSQGFTMTFLVGKWPTYPDRMGLLPLGKCWEHDLTRWRVTAGWILRGRVLQSSCPKCPYMVEAELHLVGHTWTCSCVPHVSP